MKTLSIERARKQLHEQAVIMADRSLHRPFRVRTSKKGCPGMNEVVDGTITRCEVHGVFLRDRRLKAFWKVWVNNMYVGVFDTIAQ